MYNDVCIREAEGIPEFWRTLYSLAGTTFNTLNANKQLIYSVG